MFHYINSPLCHEEFNATVHLKSIHRRPESQWYWLPKVAPQLFRVCLLLNSPLRVGKPIWCTIFPSPPPLPRNLAPRDYERTIPGTVPGCCHPCCRLWCGIFKAEAMTTGNNWHLAHSDCKILTARCTEISEVLQYMLKIYLTILELIKYEMWRCSLGGIPWRSSS